MRTVLPAIESPDSHEVLGCQIIQDFWSVEVEGFQRRKEILCKFEDTVYEKKYHLNHPVIHQLAYESLRDLGWVSPSRPLLPL